MTERQEKLDKLAPALVPWYEKNKRSMPWREDPTPYHVWLSEIMLQQTRIEAAKPYYARFLREIPDIPSLAAADPEVLQKLWEGLGYYSRVRNLQKAAQKIVSEHGGMFPEDFSDIRSLPGIGDYTAGAIASICFGKPTPAVDGNVLRVLSRITGDERPVTDEKLRASVRTELAAVYPEEKRGMFTEALMELGETLCIPNGAPMCKICPCRDFCSAKDGSWEHLPVKEAKKERRKEELTVFLLHADGCTAIRKRGEKGLLSGLWEFPNVPGHLSEEEALCQAEEWNLAPTAIKKCRSRTHIFTHIEWDMACYEVTCTEKALLFSWPTKEELKENVALPTAFRKFVK